MALGDPICPPDKTKQGLEDFVAYCERQDWIPAFYQVDSPGEYRGLAFTLVPIGSEALIQTQTFGLRGKGRHDLRYALKRCEKEGVRFAFMTGPEALDAHTRELQEVSGTWLQRRRGPELSYSLGNISTLSDPDITVGLAFAAGGRLDAFVSWLPVPARKAWTLDLMRRRPDSMYGVMEALIVHSITLHWESKDQSAGAKAWLHVQDFEVEAAFATGLPSRRSWLDPLMMMWTHMNPWQSPTLRALVP